MKNILLTAKINAHVLQIKVVSQKNILPNHNTKQNKTEFSILRIRITQMLQSELCVRKSLKEINNSLRLYRFALLNVRANKQTETNYKSHWGMRK